jgi:hypothetical protein
LVPVLDGEVGATAHRDSIAPLERVRVARERHEDVVLLEVGRRQRRGPGDGGEGFVERAPEVARERPELALRRRQSKAAHPRRDRMDGAPADQRHERVSRLLQSETALDHLAMVPGHLDRAPVSKEVGRVEHRDVQRVALDPIPRSRTSAGAS